jgi:threonyl-tRNA synthetase
MITVTFPDGAKREFQPGTTAGQVAAAISKSLEKKAVAAVINGALADLADPLTGDSQLEIVVRDDPRALELIRHDAAHVLAEAVQELFPGTQVTIGPVIENGFYYDFHRNEPFTPADFPAARQALHQVHQDAR